MHIRKALPVFILLAVTMLASCARPVATVSEPEQAMERPHRSIMEPAPFLPGDLFTQNKLKIFSREFTERSQGADYILIGEGHTSQCDHGVQARLLKALAQYRERMHERPVVGLEMVAVDRQDVLEEFNGGALKVEELFEALDWRDRWGYDFDLYKPMFEVSWDFDLPVVGVNVPPAVVRKVSAEGMESLSVEEKLVVPSELIPPSREQEKMLREAFEHHDMVMAPDGSDKRTIVSDEQKRQEDEAFKRFMRVQSLWDTAMAVNAIQAHRRFKRPVVIIAGAGHVENGWGIARRIKAIEPEASVYSVMPWRGEGEPEGADLYFYCPPSHRSSMGMTLMERDGHVVVVSVLPGSRAEKAGLRSGDVVLTAVDMPVEALGDMHKAGVKAHREKKPLVLRIDRVGNLLTIDLGLLGQKNGKNRSKGAKAKPESESP